MRVNNTWKEVEYMEKSFEVCAKKRRFHLGSRRAVRSFQSGRIQIYVLGGKCGNG